MKDTIMKPCSPAVRKFQTKGKSATQSGYTLIELMMIIAVIGILAAIGVSSYQLQLRQTQMMSIYQEINAFRTPYQMLIDQGAGVIDFSPSGLNMPARTKYCQFSVAEPNKNAITISAVTCQIQNLSYLSNETMSLNLTVDGKWYCTTSAGISKSYLPQDCQ